MSLHQEDISREGLPTPSSFIVNEFLIPRYRKILRFSRKNPHYTWFCGNLNLVACFTTSMCLAAYMYQVADDLFDEPEEYLEMHFQRERSELSSVLESRGIFTEQDQLEHQDVEYLIKNTGKITKAELSSIDASKRQTTKDAIISPDAQLIRRLIESPQSGPFFVDGAKSSVFDSELAFMEQVDDNKDSVWLLAVVAATRLGGHSTAKEHHHSSFADSIITSDVWGLLVKRYSPFGFKMGLIDCHRLQNLCHSRGFIAADLILALPKGGDRIKDSIQFRPYLRRQRDDKQPSNNPALTLRQLNIWLDAILAQRVRSATTAFHQLIPTSLDLNKPSDAANIPFFQRHWFNWLRQRPSPLHVIWRPITSQMSEAHQSIFSIPVPLVLSALSVPYTGRVHFWTLHDTPTVSSKKSAEELLINRQPVSNTHQLLDALNCPSDAYLLILTPESNCFSFGRHYGEQMNYDKFDLTLRFLYPSADDLLWILTISVNLLVLLHTCVAFGRYLAYLIRYTAGMSIPSARAVHRSGTGIARSIVRFARRGWTSHAPSRHIRESANLNDSGDHVVQTNLLKSKFLKVCQSVFLDIFSSNTLLLLCILPLINFLSHPKVSPLANLLLWSFRSITTSPSFVTLRLSVLNGHMTWLRFGFVCLITWLLLVALMTHVYFVYWSSHHPLTRSNRRSVPFRNRLLQRLNERPSQNILNDVTRLFLTASDADSQTTITSSSALSSSGHTDSSSRSPGPPTVRRRVSTRRTSSIQDSNRLLHRLTSLHQLLNDDERMINGSLNVAPPMRPDESIGQHPSTHLPSALIFTWKCKEKIHTSSKDTTFSPTIDPARIQIHFNGPSGTDDFDESDDQVSNSSVTYEAEDEGEHLTFAGRTVTRRRPRSRRPALPLNYDSDSSNAISSAAVVSSTEEESLDHESHFSDWPSWVLACNTCSVCLRRFRSRVRLGALPCGHGFHEACIRRWLDTGAPDCPVCRWPAYAPHLRQQRQMIGQLLHAVRSTLSDQQDRHSPNS